MDPENQELRPFEPVSDTLVLAAIERAQRHGPKDAWIIHVSAHLGFRHSAHTTRPLRDQLEELRVQHGWVESKELMGREYWQLTPAGEKHLARCHAEGRVGDLPDSPQHRTWRKARAAAAERIEGFKALLWSATAEAMSFEGVADPPPSAKWFELSERLAASFWLVGSALYCLNEWPEPSDDRPDLDTTDPNLGQGPPRRAVDRWADQAARARGEQP